jgi:hypothetical protein
MGRNITYDTMGLKYDGKQNDWENPIRVAFGIPAQASKRCLLSTEVCEVTRDDDLPATRIKIGKRISAKQAQQKTRYDKKRRAAPTYTVGQHVLIRKVIPTNDGKSKKLLVITRSQKFWTRTGLWYEICLDRRDPKDATKELSQQIK